MVGGILVFYSLNRPVSVCSSGVNVPSADRAFPRCMAISTLCLKKNVERPSLATNMLRSLLTPSAKCLHSHRVKMCAWLISAYFERFRTSAADAAAPAWKVVFGKFEGASVSGQVKSQTVIFLQTREQASYDSYHQVFCQFLSSIKEAKELWLCNKRTRISFTAWWRLLRPL